MTSAMGDELSVRAAEVDIALRHARSELAQDDRAGPLLNGIAARVSRAVQLMRFEVHESDGPFHRSSFKGPPKWPATPLFPRLADPGAFVGAPGAAVQRLFDAIEALQQQLVFEADCQEYVDALQNSAQFLRAAGHLDEAEPDAVALAALVRRT